MTATREMYKRAVVAHRRRNTFVDIHQTSSLAELKLLYQMFNSKDWDSLGFENWQSFCEAPVESGGLGVSREWASQLVQVYIKYVIELKVSDRKLLAVSPRKLYQLKGRVTEENVDEMIEKAKSLSLKDLELETHNIDTMNCVHQFLKEMEEFSAKCPDCRQFIKIKKSQIKKW
jgi:predicted Zn-ribbon and HTH transcriptional regulator